MSKISHYTKILAKSNILMLYTSLFYIRNFTKKISKTLKKKRKKTLDQKVEKSIKVQFPFHI